MDLLEIRKKAREKKEAEALAKAAEEAEGRAGEPEAGAPPETSATVENTAPVTKAGPAKKRKKKARPAPVADKPGREASAETARGLPEAGEEQPAGPELMQETGLIIDDEAPEGEAGHGPREAASEVVEAARVKAPEPVRKPSTPPGGGGDGPGAEGPGVLGVDGDGEDTSGDDIVEYLAFRLAKEQYAVKVSVVKEIIRLQRITMVPRAQDFVEGIISLRGVIIPVFDAKKRLGFEDTGRSRTNRIIILSEAGNSQGMIVDKVTGVARLKKSEIEPPPSVIGGVEAEYLEGLGRIDGKLLILFNTDMILSMEGQPGS